MRKIDFGGAPIIQFNNHRKTDFEVPINLKDDTTLIENLLGVGFFLYGPRLWMLGYVEPLELLQRIESREEVLKKIVREYDSLRLTDRDKFYRLRKNPENSTRNTDYDSPPDYSVEGRFNSIQQPVMYASPDIQICIHECRVTAEDESFIATLQPAENLNFLDLTPTLAEANVTEFESLDLTMFMLFMAGGCAYPILRSLAEEVRLSGFDGIAYPSYFSMLRNGVKPFETTYGIWNRRIQHFKKFEESKISKNYAIFGRPIEEGKIKVVCKNKVVLSAAYYSIHFGPVLDD